MTHRRCLDQHERRQASDKGVRVIEITELEAFAPLAQRWDITVSQTVSPNIFITSDWLQAWWAHFGAGKKLWLLLIEGDGGEAIGIAPFMIARHRAGGVSLRSLEFPGAAVPTCADHIEITCLPGREREVMEIVGRHLLKAGRRWDIANFEGAPEDSMTMNPLSHILQAERNASRKTSSSVACPYLLLEQTFANYDRHLQRKFRDLKKYLAVVERQNGRFLLVHAENEMHHILNELRRLSLLRVGSKGDVSSLVRDDFFSFLLEVCGRFLRRGWLRLYALEVDAEVIAVNLNFAYGTKVYGYMSGFNPAWTRHGIGTVLMRHVIRSAMEEGFQEYDFLRGDEEYKYRWTSCQRLETTLRIINHPWRYRAFRGGYFTARACARLWGQIVRGNGAHPLPSRAMTEPLHGLEKAAQ
jgi:CelD/BcsL family acetyltransferase involved in cellulose biosynthesis